MMEKMYDLAWKIDGDTVNLEQDGGCEGGIRVDVHISQLRLIAERAGLLSPMPAVAWPRGFKQRLLRLQTDVGYLAGDVWMDEICGRLSDGLAYRIGMTAALDTINGLLLDTGIMPDTDGADSPEAVRG
ncbi:MAG: hypothetical protein NTV11_16565 [Rhodocyclales bacterium]|nr:hypothetical protein [Rhodocyclales bacterium]